MPLFSSSNPSLRWFISRNLLLLSIACLVIGGVRLSAEAIQESRRLANESLPAFPTTSVGHLLPNSESRKLMGVIKDFRSICGLGNSGAPENTISSPPILLTKGDSTRAIALESGTLKSEPFGLTSTVAFGPDRRTRIMLFALNMNLLPGENASAVTADALDATNRLYNLTTEYVGSLQEFEWISFVIFRLDDNLGEVGDVLVRVHLRGVSSNSVRVGIGYSGGGPPDPSPTPTPGTWSLPETLASGGVVFTAMAASGDVIDVVSQNSGSIQYRRSNDEGTTWSNPVNIGTSDEIPLTEPLAAEGSYRHLLFERSNNLYYKRSTNSGATWGSDTLLAIGPANHFFRVSVSALNGHVDVVWVSHDSSVFTTDGIFYRRSFDNGATWQAATSLVGATIGSVATNPGRPTLSVFGNTLHLAWTDERDGNPSCYSSAHCPEIYYKRSTDGGSTWDAGRRLTFGNGNTMGRPDVLALSATNVVLVYQDDGNVDGEEELYTLTCSDNGVTWSTPRRQTNAPRESEHPMLAGMGNTVNLSWFDRRDGNEEIYSRTSSDAGATWGPEERLTNSAARSETPRNALTSNYVHVIYVEGGTLYYTRRVITVLPLVPRATPAKISTPAARPTPTPAP